MPERKSGKNTEQKSEITLRRSSRFHHLDPPTPEHLLNKIRPVHLFSSPTHISNSKSTNNQVEFSEFLVETKKRLEESLENETQKQYVLEKRVTRSSVRQSEFVSSPVSKCGLVNDSEQRVRNSSKTGKDKVSVKLSKECVGEKRVTRGLQKEGVLEKRVTRSAFVQSKCGNPVSDCVSEEGVSGKVSILPKEGDEKGNKPPKGCVRSNRKRVTRNSSQIKTNDLVVIGKSKVTKGAGLSRADESECDSESKSQDSSCESKKKRKKKTPRRKETVIVQGWTEGQESLLRKAYFTAKATPHFWKKVAKMVPGKSAEECFNRIHKDLSTPPQPHTRSKAKVKPSPIPLSATDLLSPATSKRKKLRSTKKSTLLAQKTIRQILQKKQNEDQDYEPDFFSILEKNSKLSPLNLQGISFSSPPPNSVGPSRFKKCVEISSSSGQKQPLSRLSSSSKVAFISPPVLKQVKNKALHDKYIDQLHCRDAKRKRELKKTQKGKNVEVKGVRVEAVKVAKDALMFEAQDAIKKFQNLQASVLDESDDDGYLSNEDDEDDEL